MQLASVFFSLFSSPVFVRHHSQLISNPNERETAEKKKEEKEEGQKAYDDKDANANSDFSDFVPVPIGTFLSRMRLSTLRFMANRFSEENPMLGGYGGRMSQNKKITVRPVF